MFFLKKIGCRLFQAAFRLALPLLPYRAPEILSSCEEVGKACQKEGVSSVLIVTDEGILKNGLTHSLEAALEGSGIRYAVYGKTRPNPTVDNVEEKLDKLLTFYENGLRNIGWESFRRISVEYKGQVVCTK